MAPPRARGRLSRVLVVLGCLLGCFLGGVVGTGCGKGRGGGEGGGGAGGRSSAPDLSSPEAVLVGLADALARGDLEALDARATPEARAAVRRDLEAFRSALRDPAVGPRYSGRLPEPVGDAETEIYRKALIDGDSAGLLYLLARAAPRPAPAPLVSPPAGRVLDGRASEGRVLEGSSASEGAAARLERDLPAGDGTRRRVVLVRQGSSWYADRIQL